jgi:hypothetical protein
MGGNHAVLPKERIMTVTTDMTEAYALAQAMVAWGESMASMVRAADTSVIDALIAGRGLLSDSRLASLRTALGLRADEATLIAIRDARRVSQRSTILLPEGKYEHCSRGRGWARLGRGRDVSWGDREEGGYRVGPGRWSVGSTDGFQRKSETTWEVEHIDVGGQTWTVAS